MNECVTKISWTGYRALVVVVVLSWVSVSHAFETEEFLTACTYGTITGTLVGTASLAFTKRPGDHFNRIARGASLGLYLGIGLGLYVASLPDSKAAEVMKDINVFPTLSPKGIDGAGLNYAVLRF